MRENNFSNTHSSMENPYEINQRLHRSNAALDDVLEMGRASFLDIQEQNSTLERVRADVSSSLLKLGVSRDTVGRIERVMFQDKVIFWVGALTTIAVLWFILKWV